MEKQLVSTERTGNWKEHDGVIRFPIISEGETGKEIANICEKEGHPLSESCKAIILSPKYETTSGVKGEVAVLKGSLIENDESRTNIRIRNEASFRKFKKPRAEIGWLIRKKLTNEDIKAMGLEWIVVMHRLIQYPLFAPDFLTISTTDFWFTTSYSERRGGHARPFSLLEGLDDEFVDVGTWPKEGGFAFVV